MDNLTNKYYIRLNEEKRIIKFLSSAFEEPLTNDILVSEGFGSQFRVDKKLLSEELQEFANIENGLPLTNNNGIYILKYENNLICKITVEELNADIENLPKLVPTDVEILQEENLMLMETVTDLYEKKLEIEEHILDVMEVITSLYEESLGV